MILARKISKYPNFYDICPKNQQNSLILHDFFPENARILHKNCPKNFFPRILGGHVAPPPPRDSYAYVWPHQELACMFINCKENGKIGAIRCQILRPKCTEFDFRWGSAPEPTGGVHSTSPDPLIVQRGR